MLIFNAGVPRSGTVMVNAMIRALLKQAGTGSTQSNPHGRELPGLIARLKRSGVHRHKPVVIHTHSWDQETERLLTGDPHVVAFANYRDPRDVCVSLMKLHDLSFEDGLKVVLAYFQAFEAVVRGLDAMILPYEFLTEAPRAHCFQIARHLGLWPRLPQVDAVVEEASLERHRKIMEDVRTGNVDDLNERNNRTRTLREDRNTLINDRHIQSGVAGRWKCELDEGQQIRADEAFAALLERYGYEQ